MSDGPQIFSDNTPPRQRLELDDDAVEVWSDYGRWPGFTEQSWQERFEELERRTKALISSLENIIAARTGDTK